MAETILDYIEEYGTRTFMDEPVNEVDSLILCQLSYLKFDGMVPDVNENKSFVTLQEVAAHKDFDNIFKNVWFEKNNRIFYEKMMKSKRFSQLKMNYYTNIIETESETQFSAITFFLEDGSVFVVYRGTDENIVGWKEDMNMAFLDPVPGQELSVRYLNTVSQNISNPFYICGHSKGGNFAVYAAMNCPKEVQNRIVKIFNMDGPSFRPEVLKNYDYAAIADKTTKILPQSSLVGMFFEQTMDYRVVKSKALGFLQHDPFSWQVKYGRFVDVGKVYDGQKFMDDTLNEWIMSLNEEQVKTFSDTLYQVITASEKDNLIEFSADWIASMNSMLSAIKEVDEETKSMIKETVKGLLRLTQARVMDEIARGPKQLIETITQKIENIETEGSR